MVVSSTPWRLKPVQVLRLEVSRDILLRSASSAREGDLLPWAAMTRFGGFCRP